MKGFIYFITITILSTLISLIVFKQFTAVNLLLIFPFGSLIGCLLSLTGLLIFKERDECGCEDCAPWSFCLSIFILSLILTFSLCLMIALLIKSIEVLS